MDVEIKNTLLGKLQPGDHIASARFGDLFQHHGIYMGLVNGLHMVTHFKAPIKDSSVSGRHSILKCAVCGYQPPHGGGLVSSCLDCFRRGEQIFIIKYKVSLPYSTAGDHQDLSHGSVIGGYRNNKLYIEIYKNGALFGHMKITSGDIKNSGCVVDTQVRLSKFHSCRSSGQVVEAAQSNHHTGKYNFMFNNCEDFAVYCMTGKERSIQAEKLLHEVPYKVSKMIHLLTDSKKLKKKCKEKFKEKVLWLLGRSF